MLSSDSPASTTRAAQRIIFRPTESSLPTKLTPNPVPKTAAAPTDYDIDFELDDEDAQAIELVFNEYNEKLKSQILKSSLPVDSIIVDKPTGTSEIPALRKTETEDEEYHDAIALDDLLDLEFDDPGDMLAFASQESWTTAPDSSHAIAVAERTGDEIEQWHDYGELGDDEDGDIEAQVLLQHELWTARAGAGKGGEAGDIFAKRVEIVDATPEREAELEAERIKKPPPTDRVKAPASDGFSVELSSQVTREDDQDPRSPLERFRTKYGTPKLSVTDLLSNMWCEQQYHYTLLRGFKRRTPQMEAGTKIHREIEEQIQTIVHVTVKTKYDKWGLRIWNMIQGMEGLRNTGITRELEVWGWLDDVWVTGVIDEVNYNGKASAQDEDGVILERKKVDDKEEQKTERLDDNVSEAIIAGSSEAEGVTPTANEPTQEASKTPKRRGRRKKEDPTASDDESQNAQASITEFVTPSPQKQPKPRRTKKSAKMAFIMDLKTRHHNKVPARGSSQSKSVHLQLMIYRHLMNEMIKSTPKAMSKKLCKYHNLDPLEPFSDDLIAQLASLKLDDSEDYLGIILEHNSIEKLYGLFHKVLKKTIEGISPCLSVEYRWQENGEVIDSAEYTADDKFLAEHMEAVVGWWKGNRETVGVDVAEAWKCRSCEFADQCRWRQSRIDEAQESYRRRKSMIVGF